MIIEAISQWQVIYTALQNVQVIIQNGYYLDN